MSSQTLVNSISERRITPPAGETDCAVFASGDTQPPRAAEEHEMRAPTYREIAHEYKLWGEYVDPEGTMDEQEFENMSEGEKIALQVDIWGPDPNILVVVQQDDDDAQ